MRPILEVSRVEQSFRSGFWLRRVSVLRDISLRVPEGAVFGFLGANGAGKTTLIHLIAGLRRPARGAVRVAGFEATSVEARQRIGYLPERPYFHEHLTGEGLLSYFGALSGLSSRRIRDRVPAVLSQVGLSDARRLELRRYSKGMLQRIGIAQAILHDPAFIVLDEPMSGLDPVGRKEVRELIGRLAGEGRTVLFSSHVIPDVEAVCDQVAVLRKGRLLGAGPIRGFLADGGPRAEIALSGLGLERAREIRGFEEVRAMPGGIRGLASGQQDIDAVLREALGAGAQVLWVSPLRPSLEQVFAGGEEGAAG